MVNFKADQMLLFMIRNPDKSSVAASNVCGNYLAALKLTNFSKLSERTFSTNDFVFLGTFEARICIEPNKG